MASSQLVAPELATIKIEGVTREAFLIRATLAAGATYGALSATPYITQALAKSGGGDVDILNYALTLEYIESEFYTLGVKRVKGLSADEMKLAKKIRDDELAHVDALIATVKKLGGTAAPKPKLDFGGAFADRATFLKTANVLEDAGVSAYNVAAPMISSGDVLGAAGSIVQVEACHASLIRLTRGRPPAPLAFDKAATKDAILKKVMPFIKG
jgi:Ferritin-like domain